MFGHLPELFIVLLIALIVFGPEKLPEVAANAGKIVREVREIVNDTLHPPEAEVPDDFSTYYYESLARAGEDVPEVEEAADFEDHTAIHEPEEPVADLQAVSAQPGEAPEEKVAPTPEGHTERASESKPAEDPNAF